MIRLLSFLLHGCFHVWEEDERLNLYDDDPKVVTGRVSCCHCKKCGRPRSFTLRS